MHAIWTVLWKEIVENIRDRRTLISAFIFVPLLGPVLFGLMTATVVDRVIGEADETLRLPVIGAEHAPNLVDFFEQNGASIARLDSMQHARAEVSAGREYFVLRIPEDFGERLKTGETAPIELLWDSSNSKAQRHVGRMRSLLESYSRRIGSLRLLARGIDPSAIATLDVRMIDTATPSGRSIALLGTLTYYLLFSLLLGGMYLAIDVTAGERERGSLESLLSLPVSRAHLVIGKVSATALFMMMSLSLTLAALVATMQFIPLEKLGMTANFQPLVALKIALILLPMALFGATLLFVVGSFTRSYREAQTWLGVVLAIPTMPILFASIANVRPSTVLMAIPSLSQHLLATNLVRGDPIEPLHIAVSVMTTLIGGALLLVLAVRLYSREKILG